MDNVLVYQLFLHFGNYKYFNLWKEIVMFDRIGEFYFEVF